MASGIHALRAITLHASYGQERTTVIITAVISSCCSSMLHHHHVSSSMLGAHQHASKSRKQNNTVFNALRLCGM
jgi:hypothetical protein